MNKKKFVLTDEWKRPAFTTPDGYFDSLQERVTARITAAPQTSRIAAWRPRLAFVACFVALMIGSFFMFNNLKSNVHLMGFLDDEYAYTASMLSIDESMALFLLSDKQEHAISTGDIINYLADARISLTDIAFLD